MTIDELIRELRMQNPHAVLLGHYQDALIGMVVRGAGEPPVALYDFERCVGVFRRLWADSSLDELDDFINREYPLTRAQIEAHLRKHFVSDFVFKGGDYPFFASLAPGCAQHRTDEWDAT